MKEKIKEIVNSKMKINSLSGPPRCRWVCFFIKTDLEKCSIRSLAHQLILYSEWVPSEWESKQLIKKKNHNNPQVTHTNPIHQLTSCEKLHVCIIKSIKLIFNFQLPASCCLVWKSNLVLIRREICREGSRSLWSERTAEEDLFTAGFVIMNWFLARSDAAFHFTSC